ncbi:PREDICTED: uncharacterized protein LOC108549732 [Eufriesea mexicana]|uniref:uncharacterized protein LOC108549732 n=1 Tax=Eufriesea mexicana TaxID=516756 RepID=UPI00083C79A3|nr:PREDICTED: uncharacterized protein LOC108549732 [Eufriesea mexicana]
MTRIFLSVLLSWTILFRASAEIFESSVGDSYSSVYPFLEKWARSSHTKMLTVVLDDYGYQQAFDVPHSIVVSLNVSIRVVSLKHLIALRYKNMRRDYQTIETGSCVLLLFTNVDHLRDILSSPHLVSFWHPGNTYILQERRRSFTDLFEYEKFCKWAFERLWRFRRVYRLLLFVHDKVIRYDPFDYAGRQSRYRANSSCDWYCTKSNEDHFLMINEPNSTDISDFFDRDRRDFKLYPLRISIFESSTMSFQGGQFSGLDYKYLEEVCRAMNVTQVFVKSKEKYGWEENGVFYGSIGHLVYKFADVSFNQFFLKDYLTRQIDFTTSITNDKLCVLVPKAAPIPDCLVIVKIFTGEAWIVVLTAHFVISMIYTILKNKRNRQIVEAVRMSGRAFFCCEYAVDTCCIKDQNARKMVPETVEEKQNGGMYNERLICENHSSELVHFHFSDRVYLLEETQGTESTTKSEMGHSKRIYHVFLTHLASFGKYLSKVVFQLMQPFQLSQPWFPERLLMMCSLLLSLILNGIITSQLASSFSKRMHYEDIDTLEKLEESGLAILTDARDVIDDALSDTTSPLIKRLGMRLEFANSSEIDRRLFVAKDAGYLHRFTTLPLEYNEYQKERLHVVKECPKNYIITNVITKGSPFGGRINSILHRLNNGGFYKKWYQNTYQSQERRMQAHQESTMHRKVTIRHLFIPFGILYIGLTTSAIVFIHEYRRKKVR